jgi:3-hydroxyisobutyrate dehydrogenase-like beta-hydroxyacid dehydrogenase
MDGTNQLDVAVIGCGNMGSAIARAALAKQQSVAIWNRSPERTVRLVDAGATVLTDVSSAFEKADLTIVCVSTTDDVRALLAQIDPARVAGTILNLTSGLPDEANELAAWAAEHDVPFLDGVILCFPEQIGSAEAHILIAGPEQLWTAHSDIVRALAGSSLHVGTVHGAANVMDAGLVGAFYMSSMVAFIEATRYMGNAGVSTDALRSLLPYALNQFSEEIHDILNRVDTGTFATERATLTVYQEAGQSFLDTMAPHGPATMIRATTSVFDRAVAAGLANEDLAAVVKLSAE